MNPLGAAHIIQGNALHLPLPDSSVDACITSPPYFGLRSYQDNGEHYAGQIGSEATPTEFLDALIAATREMVRVLKPSGSIFINLGDKYRGDKSLMGMPWRYAIRCIDQLGLILRAEIIWNKPNGLPESVTDRVRRSHENWFHFTKEPRYFAAVDEIRESTTQYTGMDYRQRVANGEPPKPHQGQDKYAGPTMFTANPLGKLPGSVWTIPTQPLTVPPELGVDHFAAYPMEWPRRIIQGWTPRGICVECGEGRRPRKGITWDVVPHRMEWRRSREPTEHERAEAGREMSLWRSELQIKRSDFVPHFPHYKNADSVTAQVSNWERGKNVPMPEDLAIMETFMGPAPERLREIVGEMAMMPVSLLDVGKNVPTTGRHETKGGGLRSSDYVAITGYACACPTPDAPTRPAVVLDPFGGTGTTALVAKALGRTGITVDLSHDYCRLAQWRCNDPRELAAALQVEKPEPAHPDQLDLFSEVADT